MGTCPSCPPSSNAPEYLSPLVTSYSIAILTFNQIVHSTYCIHFQFLLEPTKFLQAHEVELLGVSKVNFLISIVPYPVSFIALSPFATQSLCSSLFYSTYHLQLFSLHFLVSKLPYPVSCISLLPLVNKSLFSSLVSITFSQLASIFSSLKFHILSLLQHYHLLSIRAHFLISSIVLITFS